MQEEGKSAAFLAAPAGRYLVRRSFVVWCASPELFGTCIWNVPSFDEANELCALWELDRDFRQYNTIIDSRHLQHVDIAGFASVAKYLQSRRDDYGAHVRRQAIIVAGDAHTASVVAGLPTFLQFAHPWKVVTTSDDAAAWLEHPLAAPTLAELEPIIATARALSAVCMRVRELLVSDSTLTLGNLAKALGRSERTLQRELEEAGTSYRTEVRAARVRVAAELLDSTDLKVEAIAHQVGYTSISHFNTAFREVTTMSAADYRTRKKT